MHSLAITLLANHTWTAGAVYTENLLQALNILDEESLDKCKIFLPEDYSLENTEIQKFSDRILKFKGIRIRGKKDKIKRILGISKHLTLQEQIIKHQSEILFPAFHSFNNHLPCRLLSWIPDFQHKVLPDYFEDAEIASRDRRFVDIFKNTDRLILSSRKAKQDFDQYYPNQQIPVHVLPFTTALYPRWLTIDPVKIVQELKLPSRFFIFPSQFWKHKNHMLLFRAMKILKERGHNDIKLVCTGHKNDSRDPDYFPTVNRWLQENGLTDQVITTGVLNRQTQVQLIRNSLAVIQPSLFEGWSAIVEDARLFGKRILLSDLPVHKEQNPPFTTYFDRYDDEALADLIYETWQNPKTPIDNDELIMNANKRMKEFAKDFISILDAMV